MTTTPVRRRDPLKEVVHSDFLKLAGDLIRCRKQDQDYWHRIPVPVQPGDRIAHEELRQLAVFMPLALPTFAYFATNSGLAALALFVPAYPVMLLLHRRLMDDIRAEGDRQQRRDAGRFDFTRYLCEKLGLKPEEVTYTMLRKMLYDLRRYIETEAVRIRAGETAAREAREVARGHGPRVPNPGGRYSDRGGHRGFGPAVTGGFTGVGGGPIDQSTGEILTHEVNPVNGLPMMGAVDIHGNSYGTTNVDDLLQTAQDAMHHPPAQYPVDYSDQNFAGMDHNNGI